MENKPKSPTFPKPSIERHNALFNGSKTSNQYKNVLLLALSLGVGFAVFVYIYNLI